MPKHVTEEKFESDVVESLVDRGGYTQGDRANFDTVTGLDIPELFTFIVETQPTEWASLVKRHGGDVTSARTKFLSRLVSDLDQRGTVEVLRRGVEDQGVKMRLAFSRPASGLNETIRVCPRIG